MYDIRRCINDINIIVRVAGWALVLPGPYSYTIVCVKVGCLCGNSVYYSNFWSIQVRRLFYRCYKRWMKRQWTRDHCFIIIIIITYMCGIFYEFVQCFLRNILAYTMQAGNIFSRYFMYLCEVLVFCSLVHWSFIHIIIKHVVLFLYKILRFWFKLWIIRV